VIRRIEIIGEATAYLNEETRRAVPELPFRKMRGMRNIVAHARSSVSTACNTTAATGEARPTNRGDTGIIGSDRKKGLKRRAMFPFSLEMGSLILSKKRDVG
jgi:Ribonuclease HepT-like